MVSMARIELALHAPKARVMPFHYTEMLVYLDKLEKSTGVRITVQCNKNCNLFVSSELVI